MRPNHTFRGLRPNQSMRNILDDAPMHILPATGRSMVLTPWVSSGNSLLQVAFFRRTCSCKTEHKNGSRRIRFRGSFVAALIAVPAAPAPLPRTSRHCHTHPCGSKFWRSCQPLNSGRFLRSYGSPTQPPTGASFSLPSLEHFYMPRTVESSASRRGQLPIWLGWGNGCIPRYQCWCGIPDRLRGY